MDRFLYFWVEVLHAKTQAIEAQLKEQSQTRFIDSAGIHFNRIFATRHKTEAALEHRHQLAQFIVA